MKTILIMLLKGNVSSANLNNFFLFVDPFLEQQGFQPINDNPKVYMNEYDMTNVNIRNVISKIKKQTNYNQIVKSFHFGKLNKL